MLTVLLEGDVSDVTGVQSVAAAMQDRFQFKPLWVGRGDAEVEGYRAVRLRLTPEAGCPPFGADRNGGVTVSTTESHGLALYLGIPRNVYLFVCGLLGLTQWRALILNPLLQAEDLLHREPATCAFAVQPHMARFALALEHRHVCPACRDFFHCLGVDGELCVLQTVFESGSLAA